MKAIKILIVILLSNTAFAQTKNFIDLPYIETSAKKDTLVIPDRIYLTITLNEADSKNKKSTEELEKQLELTLKRLNIDTEEDLSLLDYSSNFKSYFLKGQNILKTKMYSLLIYDAVTAGRVLAELEQVGISNVVISKTEYSKSEELLLDLKYSAIKKAKKTAEKLVKPLLQKVGKAVYISDNTSSNSLQGQIVGLQIRGMLNNEALYGSRAPAEHIIIEFQKLKFETEVKVNFLLE